jgi:serine/threonine protein kinase
MFEVLGEGAFSIVHRAIFLPTGEEIAVKVIKDERTTSNVIQFVKQEAELLNRLDHPNVIKVKHLIQLNGRYYMGMEYSAGGSL